MSPIYIRHGPSTESNPAESDSSGETAPFGDPVPETFMAAIPFPEPIAQSRGLYVQP
jgi:hypothetical protein